MRVPIATMVIAAATAGALGCRASSAVLLHDAMPAFLCDTALKRPLRPAEIPDVSLAEGYGSLTGVVFRVGTGNGVDSASIILSPQDSSITRSGRVRVTGQKGGFAFDSILPGRYRLRVLAPWEHKDCECFAFASI